MSTITIREWEGGIEAGTREVIISPSMNRLLDLMDCLEHCSCRGEAHDECAPDDEEEW